MKTKPIEFISWNPIYLILAIPFILLVVDAAKPEAHAKALQVLEWSAPSGPEIRDWNNSNNWDPTGVPDTPLEAAEFNFTEDEFVVALPDTDVHLNNLQMLGLLAAGKKSSVHLIGSNNSRLQIDREMLLSGNGGNVGIKIEGTELELRKTLWGPGEFHVGHSYMHGITTLTLLDSPLQATAFKVLRAKDGGKSELRIFDGDFSSSSDSFSS